MDNFVHLGKADVNSPRQLKVGENVVLNLCKEYHFTNRMICADNFFTSIPLRQKLWALGFKYIGTLK
jgi:hypothetical protein